MHAMPIIYNVRNLAVRKASTLFTALGIALVVFIFTSMLAFVQGLRGALVNTGHPENVLVLRGGATGEIQSYIPREDVALLRGLPEVARDSGGQPLLTADLLVVINHPKRGSSDPTNVSVRGVLPQGFTLRPEVQVVQGRAFRPGVAEVIVGRSLSRRIQDTSLGDRIRFGGQEWEVVGIFEAGGTAYESEIWGDAELFLPAFDRPGYQSATFRLADPGRYEELKRHLEEEPQLEVQVKRESEFYAGQSKSLVELLRTLAIFIGAIMSVGAVFGAVNTMYAAVAARTREIGTLIAIGFTPGAVLRSFVIESLLIAGLGGVIGAVLAFLVANGRSTGTTNWDNFSEITFRLAVTPDVALAGILFALLMGLIGGYLPARRAARLKVAEAVRAV
jgi:ABC-type lipoprotein release transport system permease subunit